LNGRGISAPHRSEPKSKRQYVEGHNTAALRLARDLPGARRAIFPKFIPPSLATPEARPPRGKNWVHEVKYDGYRFQCHIQRGIRFYTRRGYDWTERLPHLVTALQPLSQNAAILDGEVIVQTRAKGARTPLPRKELKAKGGSEKIEGIVD
jgi:ATP-dependent DNA ligase